MSRINEGGRRRSLYCFILDPNLRKPLFIETTDDYTLRDINTCVCDSRCKAGTEELINNFIKRLEGLGDDNFEAIMHGYTENANGIFLSLLEANKDTD